ncbi:delta(24)-sterol reductase-like [Elysia marginata]|uniref:Delta(24)-sterol reductase-like n=1 Tax=Elysia marginata TaxID=1093978 RepID=A0AAV4GID2_9GAST|nr:delta(24)-sterol reductase-like [Elysia marginata]
MELDLNGVFYFLVPVFLTFSWLRFRGLEYIIINYRWIFVCTFLLPLSVFYDAFMYIRAKIVFALNSAPKQHDTRVANVQRQTKVDITHGAIKRTVASVTYVNYNDKATLIISNMIIDEDGIDENGGVGKNADQMMGNCSY